MGSNVFEHHWVSMVSEIRTLWATRSSSTNLFRSWMAKHASCYREGLFGLSRDGSFAGNVRIQDLQVEFIRLRESEGFDHNAIGPDHELRPRNPSQGVYWLNTPADILYYICSPSYFPITQHLEFGRVRATRSVFGLQVAC